MPAQRRTLLGGVKRFGVASQLCDDATSSLQARPNSAQGFEFFPNDCDSAYFTQTPALQLSMADSTKAEKDLTALRSTISTILTLITQLQSTAQGSNFEPHEKTNSINALDLAHDSASLVKAHSTKLSLLIINKPFTATAISTVLRELISGPLPGLASAVEICNAAKYTKAMASELRYRALKVFSELETFVRTIPLDGKVLSDDQKNGTGTEKGKGSLTNTGMVWQACEAVMGLKTLGVAGLAIKRAEDYRDLLKDALEELQEWSEEDSDTEDGNEDVDSEEEELSAQAKVDNLFASQRHIPANDPDKLRPRLEFAQKRLRLIILMYQAVVKRRFKTLPDLPYLELAPSLQEKSEDTSGTVSSCLDEVLGIMKTIPEIIDELANAFYELDGEEIDTRMDECFRQSNATVEPLLQNWDGQEDEFTAWVRLLTIVWFPANSRRRSNFSKQ